MAATTLELVLAPDQAGRLFRHRAIAGKPRGAAASISFFCSADGALGEAGLALVVEQRRRGAVQRLVRCMPIPSGTWLPGQPMPVLAEATLPDLQPQADLFAGIAEFPAGVVPQGLAAFSGRARAANAGEGGPRVRLLDGTLSALAAERAVARVTLAGERGAVFALAASLAADLPLAVPSTSLAEEARGLARGQRPRPLRLGAPVLPRAASTAEAFAAIVSHLALAILAHAPAAFAGETPEGVHQLRVALRRLRSALSLFRDVAGPDGKLASSGLKALAATLGPARDWDVFCGGSLRAVVAAFAGDERLVSLAGNAVAVREAAYAALRDALESPGFRVLGLSLAALAAQPIDAPEIVASAPARDFAARALNKRLKRVLRHGDDLSDLPAPELHRLRLDAKRLRYAGEMFAPLFGQKKSRRFLKALAALQEELGHLNDAAVAAGLLAHLAAPGEGRVFAIGAVEGWIAAKADGSREAAFAAWEAFLSRDVFWDD